MIHHAGGKSWDDWNPKVRDLLIELQDQGKDRPHQAGSWSPMGDDYAAQLRTHIRVREPERLLDRLLVFAVIEGRSAERLALLAGALEDPKARELYASLAEAEVRHRDVFLALARDAAPGAWRARAAELAAIEAELLADRMIIARVH